MNLVADQMGRVQSGLDPTVPIPVAHFEGMPEPRQKERYRVLILGDVDHFNSNVTDDIFQYAKYSRHDVEYFNPVDQSRGWLKRLRRTWQIPEFDRFDIILIHFSLFILVPYFLPSDIERRLIAYKGIKMQTIRDECRRVDEMAAKMEKVGINALFSVLRPHHVEQVYHHPGLRSMFKVSTLPGYAPEWLIGRQSPRIAERPLHVTYRSRPLKPELGRFAQEKIRLGQRLAELAPIHDLRVDISTAEEDRAYGEDWANLLTAGKAALSPPGGVSIFDFTGEAARSAAAYRKKHPGASDEDIHRNVLAPFEGNIVHKQITPRTFEAIALRTALLMPVSDYRGVLEPWQHYMPIEGWFENIEEIVGHLNDDAFLQDMADRTFEEIIVRGRYTRARFVELFDLALDHLVPAIRAQMAHRQSH